MFEYSIADLAVFLGKSPATLRGWERKGLLVFPRKGKRRILCGAEVSVVAEIAREAGRITEDRYATIIWALDALYELERLN